MSERKGQQTFRRRLLKRTGYCEATLCSQVFALDACHIKPHKFCDTEEKMDPTNALCLMASIHRAFDEGLITFNPSDGKIILSSLLDKNDVDAFGLSGNEQIRLCINRPKYLKYHMDYIFKS